MNGNGIALKSLLQSNALEVPFFSKTVCMGGGTFRGINR